MEQDPAFAESLIVRLHGQTDLQMPRVEDAEELFTVIDRNRDHLRQWLPWIHPEYSVEDARRFLAENIAEIEGRESLTMMIRHRGALCGAIGLHRIDQRHRNSSIGYWIDREHQGKGIVSAACRVIVTQGFGNFGLHRIEIRCATWNHRSSAIPRRLGFVEEGILREAEWLYDRWVDLRVFSMLAQDWKDRD
jgi:ribosomal-protein-serine acetyltransferase